MDFFHLIVRATRPQLRAGKILRLRVDAAPCLSVDEWTPDWRRGAPTASGGLKALRRSLEDKRCTPPPLAVRLGLDGFAVRGRVSLAPRGLCSPP